MNDPSTNELELKKVLDIMDNHHCIVTDELGKSCAKELVALIDKANLKELKTMWNETQPDIVPQGFEQDSVESRYLQKRIAQLEQQTKEES